MTQKLKGTETGEFDHMFPIETDIDLVRRNMLPMTTIHAVAAVEALQRIERRLNALQQPQTDERGDTDIAHAQGFYEGVIEAENSERGDVELAIEDTFIFLPKPNSGRAIKSRSMFEKELGEWAIKNYDKLKSLAQLRKAGG